MTDTFLDDEVLGSFPVDAFLDQRPFPWSNLSNAIRPEAFERLVADFPPLELFEWHEDRERTYGQRPHNRYYMAYKSDRYPAYPGLPMSAFPETWRGFLNELETSRAYHDFVSTTIGLRDAMVRYTFHLGVRGSEVSPHVDKGRKAGTHIFYFNTDDDWDPAWGGETLVLDGNRANSGDPDFGDFDSATKVENLGNRSFLFRNTDKAWHGVLPLTCPDGVYRRLFNVIFERPEPPAARSRTVVQRVKRRARRLLPIQ